MIKRNCYIELLPREPVSTVNLSLKFMGDQRSFYSCYDIPYDVWWRYINGGLNISYSSEEDRTLAIQLDKIIEMVDFICNDVQRLYNSDIPRLNEMILEIAENRIQDNVIELACMDEYIHSSLVSFIIGICQDEIDYTGNKKLKILGLQKLLSHLLDFIIKINGDIDLYTSVNDELKEKLKAHIMLTNYGIEEYADLMISFLEEFGVWHSKRTFLEFC